HARPSRATSFTYTTPYRSTPGVGDSFDFLLLGDTGEGDASQYAVVPGMLKAGEGTAFAILASDIIYPAGSGNDYRDKFFRPYQQDRKSTRLNSSHVKSSYA